LVLKKKMALQFINIKRADQTHSQWSVAPEAEEYLSKLRTPIRVVCYCGDYRHGKSYLAGRSVNDTHHFKTSSGVQPQTRGLQLSSKFMQGTNILALDSEGLNSPDSTITLDTQIMALAVLFSSKVIYNCPNKISSQSLDGLQCAIDCAQWLAEKTATDNKANSQQRQKPQLLWLLRDFTLKLEDGGKNPMTPSAYLETALQQGNNSKVLQDSLSQLFEHRCCIPLPPPTSNTHDLVEMKNLTPAFENGVSAVLDNIRSTPAKLIDGAEMTGPVLLTMAKTMCTLLSQGGAPQLQTVWESVRATRILEARTLVLEQFTARLSGLSTPDVKLLSWSMEEVIKELKQALAVWDAHPCEKKSSDSSSLVVTCLEHVMRASQCKVEAWRQQIEKAAPDVEHLLPHDLRQVLRPILVECEKLREENVAVKLEHDNLLVTLDDLKKAQHPSLTHALANEDELHRMRDECESLQTQLTQASLLQSAFQKEVERQVTETRVQIHTKTEECKVLQKQCDQQRQENAELEQELSELKKSTEKRDREVVSLRETLAKECHKRTLQEADYGAVCTELDYLKAEKGRIQADSKRLKTELLAADAKNRQWEVANMFRSVANGFAIGTTNGSA